MAVLIKSKNLSWLTLVGAMPGQIDLLKQMGATYAKSKDGGFSIYIGGNQWTLEGGNFGCPGAAEVQVFLAEVIKDWNYKHSIAANLVAMKKMSAVMAESVLADMPDEPVSPGETIGGSSKVVIPLRDAKALYQRVVGTSEGSVYVVVAISVNGKVKIAAKVEGGGASLSVRAEGDGMDSDVVTRLSGQGMTLKVKPQSQYMSGHYHCNQLAPPDKVLGAILLGSGIPFRTPLPTMDEVVKGSK